MAVEISVPATSANLGPGFDSMAAALDLRLELSVEPAAEFSIDADIDVPLDRSNLLVRAFERVMPADRFAFRVRSGIPLCGGLGSSACAALGGVLAARALGGECIDPLALAIEIDGVVDNATAAWQGGVAIHADGEVVRLGPPRSVVPLLVIPERSVNTDDARAVLPEQVQLAEAVANAGRAAILGAGIAADDPEMIAKGLGDHLHQERRSELYPESWHLLADATGTGAIGATISGAGAAVLVWARAEDAGAVAARLEDLVRPWGKVTATAFSGQGATVDGEDVA